MVKFIPGTATVITQSVSTAKSKKSINPVDRATASNETSFIRGGCPVYLSCK